MLISPLDYNQRERIIQKLKFESRPGRGFYFLLILSIIIATFGLLINSSTSIIGGMLVAPFLFPILATGGAVISGDHTLFRRSLRTILFSTLIAIATATILTMLSPLSDLTSEILARTKPTLIDLFIALASGAAGAYAYAKKEALATLPGVAIATALVPPLGVIGFAIGSSRGELVVDASLLYLANLLAIIVASVITFYLLGFSPGRKKEKQTEARKDFVISVLLFTSVMVILSLLLVRTINDAQRSQNVESALQTFLKHYKDTQVLSVKISQGVSGTVVTATLRGPSEFTNTALHILQKDLSAKLGQDVHLKIIQIPAVRLEPR